MIEILKKAAPLIFTAIAVAIIFAIWKWIKKLPGRLKKRWHVKTGSNDAVMMTFNREMLSRPRRPKNWWCALLLFLGINKPSLWDD